MSGGALLEVEGLRTLIGRGPGAVRAVDGVSFRIRRGEAYALVGESGCGKSMTALSILGLVPRPAARIVEGSVRLDGTDLLRLPERELRAVRGRRIGMVFQEPQTALNPVLSVETQIGEALTRHLGLRGRARRERVLALLREVGIPDPERRLREYPHQLSGGMKQRVVIAMAIACDPELVIADEPTTALDVTLQAQVLELLRRERERRGMALLLITHDLGVVAENADRVAVMYAGEIVEEAPRGRFFREPRHPYTQGLFEALPDRRKRARPLAAVPGTVPSLAAPPPGCRFAPRCALADARCRSETPGWTELGEGHRVRCHAVAEGRAAAPAAPPPPCRAMPAAAGAPLLEVRGLAVHFPVRKGVLRRTVAHVRAVDGLSFALAAGRTLALVGESGCGKTTAGKAVLQLLRPTAGSVRFDGTELTRLRGRALRRRRRDMQIVFQDPYASMNPRMLVGDIVAEGIVAQRLAATRAERERRVAALLEQVGLPADAARRYPHEFSGGQRQRICIARALAVEPRLVVCDEPTSALDVSVQAQILNLLRGLQDRLGLAYLFISHDLAVVSYLAHEIAVMYLGRIVEHGPVDAVLDRPLHPYTEALLAAAPTVDAATGRRTVRLAGEPPSPVRPPPGCHFHARCPHAMPRCREAYPPETEPAPGHRVRCFLHA